jgi:AcrR family transcriptional regulator
MSPRPRKASDDDVFAAAHRAMSRLGPNDLTLAAIAAEAGVTAGALVQRFGSKRELLLALAKRAAGGTETFVADLRRRHALPLDALRAYAECMAQMAASPAAFARNLAYLQIDLTDADFRRHLVAQARAMRGAICSLVEAAIELRELRPGTDADALSRTIETALSGSLMTWAFYREGPAASWLKRDLDAVLAPYVATTRRARRRHS